MFLSYDKQNEMINKWQNSIFFKDLICVSNDCNGKMKTDTCNCIHDEFADHLILICPKCKTVSHYVPEIVFQINYEAFDNLAKMIKVQ